MVTVEYRAGSAPGAATVVLKLSKEAESTRLENLFLYEREAILRARPSPVAPVLYIASTATTIDCY